MSVPAPVSHHDLEPHVEAELAAVDMVGRLMEFWGFKRHLGRLWTLLFFSEEPLSAADLSERLGLSASAVSATLAELTRWRAVRKTWVPGERRDYYEAETSIWKMVTGVVAQRELALVREARDAFADAEEVLRDAARSAPPAERRRLEFVLRRLATLRALSVVGERLLRAVVAGEAVDPGPIREAGAAQP